MVQMLMFISVRDGPMMGLWIYRPDSEVVKLWASSGDKCLFMFVYHNTIECAPVSNFLTTATCDISTTTTILSTSSGKLLENHMRTFPADWLPSSSLAFGAPFPKFQHSGPWLQVSLIGLGLDSRTISSRCDATVDTARQDASRAYPLPIQH